MRLLSIKLWLLLLIFVGACNFSSDNNTKQQTPDDYQNLLFSVDETSTIKPDGSAKVPLVPMLKLNFTEAVLNATVNTSNIKMMTVEGNISIPLHIELGSSKSSITITSDKALEQNTKYSLQIENITNQTKNKKILPQKYYFTTISQSDPVNVFLTKPTPEQKNVDINTEITFCANKPVIGADNVNNIKIFNSADSSQKANIKTITGKYGNCFLAILDNALLYGVKYVVNFDNIKDFSGNVIAPGTKYYFTTSAKSIPFEVQIVSDSANANYSEPITIKFSKAVQQSTVTNETISIKDENNNEVAHDVVALDSVSYAISSKFFDIGQTYKICFNNEIRALDDEKMAARCIDWVTSKEFMFSTTVVGLDQKERNINNPLHSGSIYINLKMNRRLKKIDATHPADFNSTGLPDSAIRVFKNNKLQAIGAGNIFFGVREPHTLTLALALENSATYRVEFSDDSDHPENIIKDLSGVSLSKVSIDMTTVEHDPSSVVVSANSTDTAYPVIVVAFTRGNMNNINSKTISFTDDTIMQDIMVNNIGLYKNSVGFYTLFVDPITFSPEHNYTLSLSSEINDVKYQVPIDPFQYKFTMEPALKFNGLIINDNDMKAISSDHPTINIKFKNSLAKFSQTEFTIFPSGKFIDADAVSYTTTINGDNDYNIKINSDLQSGSKYYILYSNHYYSWFYTE